MTKIVSDFTSYRLHGYAAQLKTDPTSHAEQVAALALTKGLYQESLITGAEAVSGGTPKGKAARYIGRYRASRDNLFSRMQDAGIRFEVLRFRGVHPSGYRINRDVIVFGLEGVQ